MKVRSPDMNVTAQEKLMYGVMKAVYDSGIPVSFNLLKSILIDPSRHRFENL